MTVVDHVSPELIYPSSNQTLEPALGSRIILNCTVRLPSNQHCDPALSWMKDGHWLDSESHQSTHECFLGVNLTSDEDYGVFACFVRNTTATFTLQKSGSTPGHLSAVLAALVVLGMLLVVAVIYVKYRLSVLLWYRNRYGELEINDGKLYDAYVSYANSSDDRKFVNFIVKPQLENRNGYKLFLDDTPILPNSEPSADLIMNISRCRRLIVVLSHAYLEQDWCNNFSQYREIAHPAISLLKQHKSAVTLLLWRSGSMTPSSDFWKEMCLALPRKVSYQGVMGDPQIQLQEDKDPMLILHSSYLECRGDPHLEGDLGPRRPVFKGPPPPRVFGPNVPPAGAMEEVQLGENPKSEIDISDLGSRNYGARTDFYCLVTGEDI
uniref:Single Ig and TIR domain containing n=1 Tax=Sphenodon punctatus TaxID=8508 RepID=A0A8D0L671_SPHPU